MGGLCSRQVWTTGRHSILFPTRFCAPSSGHRVRTGPNALSSHTATPVVLHTSQSGPGLCLCEVPSAGCSSLSAGSIPLAPGPQGHLLPDTCFPRELPSTLCSSHMLHEPLGDAPHEAAPVGPDKERCAGGVLAVRSVPSVCVLFYFCGPEPTGVPVVRPWCPARVFTVNTDGRRASARARPPVQPYLPFLFERPQSACCSAERGQLEQLRHWFGDLGGRAWCVVTHCEGP